MYLLSPKKSCDRLHKFPIRSFSFKHPPCLIAPRHHGAVGNSLDIDNPYSDDYEDDFLDFEEGGSILKNVGPLELAPIEEDLASNFSATLNEHIKMAAQTRVKLLNSDDEQAIAFKSCISKITQKYEKQAEAGKVTFQSEIEPAHVDVKLKHLEKVVNGLLDECMKIDTLSGIVLTSQMEFGEYVIRIAAFMSSAPKQTPKKLSKALNQKTAAIGINLAMQYRENNQVNYDIAMSLKNKAKTLF